MYIVSLKKGSVISLNSWALQFLAFFYSNWSKWCIYWGRFSAVDECAFAPPSRCMAWRKMIYQATHTTRQQDWFIVAFRLFTGFVDNKIKFKTYYLLVSPQGNDLKLMHRPPEYQKQPSVRLCKISTVVTHQPSSALVFTLMTTANSAIMCECARVFTSVHTAYTHVPTHFW